MHSPQSARPHLSCLTLLSASCSLRSARSFMGEAARVSGRSMAAAAARASSSSCSSCATVSCCASMTCRHAGTQGTSVFCRTGTSRRLFLSSGLQVGKAQARPPNMPSRAPAYLGKGLLPGLGAAVELGARQQHALVAPPHLPPDGQQDGVALLWPAGTCAHCFAASLGLCRWSGQILHSSRFFPKSTKQKAEVCFAPTPGPRSGRLAHLAAQGALVVPELQEAAGVSAAGTALVQRRA